MLRINYMFDCAASIVTEKKFEDITVPEFCAAMRKRLDDIEAEDNPEAFGLCDAYEEEPARPLFHVCEDNDEFGCYGIYWRRKDAPPTDPFGLAQVLFTHENAVKTAQMLATQSPNTHYSVQGVKIPSRIPETYTP